MSLSIPSISLVGGGLQIARMLFASKTLIVGAIALCALSNIPRVDANPCFDCLDKCNKRGGGAKCAIICAPACGGELIQIVRKLLR